MPRTGHIAGDDIPTYFQSHLFLDLAWEQGQIDLYRLQKKQKQKKSQLNKKIDRIVNWAPALSFTRPEKVTTIVHYNCCWKRSSSDLNGTRNILNPTKIVTRKEI